MTAWWRWSGNLRGREKWDDLKPHEEGWWRKNAGKRGGTARPKSGVQHKTGLVGEKKLKPYAPHGTRENEQTDEQTNERMN